MRCFEDDNIIHVDGRINPINDIEVINLELILSDLQTAENILQKLEKQAKLGQTKLHKATRTQILRLQFQKRLAKTVGVAVLETALLHDVDKTRGNKFFKAGADGLECAELTSEKSQHVLSTKIMSVPLLLKRQPG